MLLLSSKCEVADTTITNKHMLQKLLPTSRNRWQLMLYGPPTPQPTDLPSLHLSFWMKLNNLLTLQGDSAEVKKWFAKKQCRYVTRMPYRFCGRHVWPICTAPTSHCYKSMRSCVSNSYAEYCDHKIYTHVETISQLLVTKKNVSNPWYGIQDFVMGWGSIT